MRGGGGGGVPETGREGGIWGEPNSSHLPVPAVAVLICRGLVVPPVVVVVATPSWVVAFPLSPLVALSVVSPVVAPPLWLAVLGSQGATGGEAVLVPVAQWLVVAVVPWGLLLLG